jgi:NAD(P)-dependent dehydrogenase (short-subunit alcohol dehydrogenase family)
MGERLRERVALVFGAGCCAPGWGNGRATSVAYAREGARVVAVDKDTGAAEETARLIREEGGQAQVVRADVTDHAQVKAAVSAARDAFGGRIDILHNNVGITAMGGPVDESLESWEHVMRTNVTGVFLTCKETLPVMLAQGKGAIVNISSLAAIRYAYPYSSYYASKAGINQFTIGLALQYARQGIRANVVMPGLMNTPLIYQQISGQYASTEAMVAARDAACPMGFMGTAWDVAWASVFLASDEARYITGVCLPVDGGLHCRT